MCGICGVYSLKETVRHDRLIGMRDLMFYRGPDDSGVFFSETGQVGLGHRRLSIIDIIGGTQPMRSACGRYIIVYNGEIYNYIELKKRLKDLYPFRTNSDTEVLLASFVVWGLDCLAELNGMFAFALYDIKENRLILARDPAGIKPLYYYYNSDRFLFASEIKCILAYDKDAVYPDFSGIVDYLTFQYTLGDKTLFKDIKKLQPGEWLSIDVEGIKREKYFRYEFESDDKDFDATTDEFERFFKDSVRIQLRSDVPLGCHLSGGVDTGLITSEAAGRLNGDIDTFTAGFKEGGVFDDTEFASITAKFTSTRQHVVFPDKNDFLELFQKLIWHMDEPAAGEGMFPQYCVSKLAAEHVKVVLGGQGADELYGGYTRYYLHLWLTAMTRRVLGKAPEPGQDIPDLIPFLPQLKKYWPLWSKVMNGKPFPSEEELFFRTISRCPDLSDVLSSEALEALNGYSPKEEFTKIFNMPDKSVGTLNRILHFETTQWLPALLHVEDRMSMACSLESRVPFLDTRILSLAFRTPGRIKMFNGQIKSILRAIAAKRLPKSIYSRQDKIGFPVPIHSWGIDKEIQTIVGKVPQDLEKLFRPDYIEACFNPAGPGDRKLWGWLCLATWWKTFIGE